MEDFQLAVRNERNAADVLVIFEEVFDCKVQAENHRDFGDVFCTVFGSRTGFRQLYYVHMRRDVEYGEGVKFNWARRVASELGEYVLLENFGDSYFWCIFTPDGREGVVELVDTEDSADISELDKINYGLS